MIYNNISLDNTVVYKDIMLLWLNVVQLFSERLLRE